MEAKLDQSMDVREVWRSTLQILREQVPEPSFRTWLEVTRLREIKAGDAKPKTGRATAMRPTVATIAVPSAFAAEWLQRRYSRPIAEALRACLGRSADVVFTVEAPPSCRATRAIRALDGISPQIEEHHLPMAVGQSGSRSGEFPVAGGQIGPRSANRYPRGAAVDMTARSIRAQHDAGVRSEDRVATLANRDPEVPLPALNPRFTFDRFLIGRGNQLAASVSRRVAEAPGTAYNPLFIYGLRGVGKTHLLQAIGNDAHTRTGSRVLCVSAVLFDDHTASQAPNSRLVVQETLRNADLLLVDDLHHIAGARGRVAQRSLAALVEGMLSAGKGVVVTSTQSLDSMLALNDMLHSRLRGGMAVALDLPDAELGLRVLGQLAQQNGVLVEQGALQLLASAGKSMAEISATWERVRALRSVSAGSEQARVMDNVHDDARQATRCRTQEQTATVSVEDMQSILAEVNSEINNRADSEFILRRCLGPDRIIDQVASYFDLEINELCSASRTRGVMVPRQIAMYLIREQTDRSYEWIAHRFAKQDHTTAMHACARIGELLETSLEIRQMVLELRQMIFGEHQRSHATGLAG